MSRNAELDKLYELLEGFGVAMMTTQGQDGLFHSRPMLSQGALPDADLVFVSSLETEKVGDIAVNPKVNLAYYRDGDRAWISVAGLATISQDRARIEQLYKEAWKVWFPNGPQQEDLCLILVQVQEVTFWKPEHGKIGSLFAMAGAYLSGHEPSLPPAQSMIIPA